jgi:uncharacterized protein
VPSVPVLAAQARQHNGWTQRCDGNDLQALLRKELADGEGMLFLCDEPAVQQFWMKDTPLPLSIAVIDEDGTISKIDDMEPETLDSHSSDKPVRYILEVNQGWFVDKGIGPGTRLVGPLFLAASTRIDSASS